MNLDPDTFQPRFDVWTAPGVERFDYCWITKFPLKRWEESWASPLKRIEMEQYFAHVGDDVMVATILRKTLNIQGDDYERQIVIYAETDDIFMLDELVHAEDKSEHTLKECMFWPIHRDRHVRRSRDFPVVP